MLPVAPTAAKGPPRTTRRRRRSIDARDGHVLYRRGATEQRAIASATKLMTALVAIEELPLERRVRAVALRAGPAESRIDLRAGERMSVADLLRALLLESANDAASTLAVRASGSVRRVRRPDESQRRAQMGLARTHFANPDRARRSREPLLRRATSRASPRRVLAKRLPRGDGRHAARAPDDRRAHAHRRQPQPPGRHGSLRSTASRPATPRPPDTCSSGAATRKGARLV